MPFRKSDQPVPLDVRLRRCVDDVEQRGQSHVLQWWDSLGLESRERLISDIESIPWDVVDPLLAEYFEHESVEPAPKPLRDLTPAPAVALNSLSREQRDAACETGQEFISAGKVAAFMVAGGQGTRLGVAGPKGAVKVTPVRGKTLFQLFGEIIIAAAEKHSCSVPWYIMTNPNNHEQTGEFLQEHGFFGIPESDVFLFPQGLLPSFDSNGKFLLAAKDRLALSPDGHGGSIRALNNSGALQDMKDRGIELLSYFQVDNPLVHVIDELFVGLHRSQAAEVSTKVASKRHDLERVGNVCCCDGKVQVIEYSDLPEEVAAARNADGTRKFNWGNLAIHLFDVEFLERVAANRLDLPYHRAIKRVAFVDDNGAERSPPEPNATKFETFIFDTLPLASRALLLEVDRSEEFSPVKNATGEDSLQSALRDQIHRGARWLTARGLDVPSGSDGQPDIVVEISPACAMTKEDFLNAAADIPPLDPGAMIYID